jgi:hypothetical protein
LLCQPATNPLEPGANDSTLVICETFYEPRGLVARMANAALMRRRFAGVRADLLRGLKQVVEATSTGTARAAPGTPAAATAAAGSR